MNYAINSPTGDLAQGLVNALFARKLKRNQRIAKDLKPRTERLLALSGEGGHHALTVIAEQTHGLYVLDPAWTRAVLLPRFDPKQAAAEAAWSGFLAALQMPSPALFRHLKPHFLGAFSASPQWTCEELPHLGDMLLLALGTSGRHKSLLSFAEARTALRTASAAIRRQTLFFLRSPQRADRYLE